MCPFQLHERLVNGFRGKKSYRCSVFCFSETFHKVLLEKLAKNGSGGNTFQDHKVDQFLLIRIRLGLRTSTLRPSPRLVKYPSVERCLRRYS